MAMAERTLRADEVQRLSASGRLCLVIHGKVYDVSDFAAQHPGGESVLLRRSGRDATEAFEDAAHSGDARDIMQQYYIGELDTEGSTSEKLLAKKTPRCSPPSCRWLAVAAVGAVALAVAWRYSRRA